MNAILAAITTGRFFRVTFVNGEGHLRTLTCKTSRSLAGYRADRGVVTVWTRAGIRAFRVARLVEMAIDGQVYGFGLTARLAA